MVKRSTSVSFIELVKADNRIALEQFYNEQKETFLKWASRRFDCDHDTIIDVYQDAIVILYHNIKDGKIEEFEQSAEGYLFGIARNLLLKRSLKNKKLDFVEDIKELIPDNVDYDIYDQIDKDHFSHELEQAFKSMPPKCREIVYLFYYHKYSLESIADKLSYNNSDTVKTRKNQCMKKLRKILLDKI